MTMVSKEQKIQTIRNVLCQGNEFFDPLGPAKAVVKLATTHIMDLCMSEDSFDRNNGLDFLHILTVKLEQFDKAV